jgi:hypothetical protein
MYRDLRFEIQVRTIAQHAWATVDHKLRYKRESDVPPELQRDLWRLSAVFELADKQFSDIRRHTAELASSYAERVSTGDLGSLGLNRDALTAYMAASEWPEYWADEARKAGWLEATSDPWGPGYLDRLATSCEIAGLTDLGQLQEFLAAAARWGPGVLAEVAGRSETEGYRPFAIGVDAISALLLCWGRASADDIARTEFNDGIQAGLLSVIEDAPEEF